MIPTKHFLETTSIIPAASDERPIVQYFDALAGSGKTHRIAKVAKHWASQGRVVIIAMIGTALIDATYERYFVDSSACRVPVSRIHSGNAEEDDERSVTKRLMEALREASGAGGRIIMMTHAALLLLPYIEGRRACSLIVDETPCPSAAFCLPLPEGRDLLDLLSLHDSEVPGYGHLVATNKAAVRRISCGGRSSFASLRDVCDHLTNSHRRCYARTATFDEFGDKSRGETSKTLWIFSELDVSVFEGFREVVVASALFEDTMLYQSWLQSGVRWQPVGAIWKIKGAPKTHDNGDSLCIYYAMTPDYSKRVREAVVDDGGEMTLIESILARTDAIFKNEPFLYNINKDILDEDKWGKALLPAGFSERGTQLSGNPHGINEYMNDWHNVAIIAALNPSPQHFAFQKARGIDGQRVKDAIYRTICYQMMLRCSLRKKGDDHPKKVVVMDKGTAEYLAALFPGSQVLYLPNLSGTQEELFPLSKPIGRPTIHASPSDKQAAYRDRQRIEKRRAELHARINRLSINQVELVIDQKTVSLDHDMIESIVDEEGMFCVTKPLDKEEDLYKGFRNAISTRVRFPLFRSRATKTPSDLLRYQSSVEFLEYLYGQTSVRVRSKHQNELISTSNFVDREGSSTKIGRENVAFTFGVWFDCDGDSDLHPEEFAGWFPNLEMVFYATSKSTKSNLRWRAYFPTSIGMDVEVYELIVAHLIEIINQHGYWSAKELAKSARLPGRRRHGFDKGVWRPETKIYLPAVPADSEGAYSALYIGEDRAPIDIMAWIDSQIDTILEREDEAQHEAELVREAIQAPTFTPVKSGVSPKLQEMRWHLQRASRPSTQGYDRDAAIERATDAWRSTPKGQGHAEFWRYACRLRAIGLDDAELEQQLRSEAHTSSSSGSERTAEIPNIVRSLVRRGRL